MNDIEYSILRHRKANRKWFCPMLFIAILLSSCSFSEESINQKLSEIETDIDLKDYDAARSKLKKYSSMHDDFIYRYNLSVIDIESNNCEKAKIDLESMLAELEQKEERPEQNVLLSQYKKNKLNGYIHLAIAKAILCGKDPASSKASQWYEESLAHLYTASTYGIELNDAILEVIHRWIPSCETFMSTWQIPALHPDKALEISSLEGQELTICPNGVWLKVQARNHEALSSSIQLTPLPRQIWLDDSSKLPFAQLQIDVFNHIPNDNDFPIAHFSQPMPETIPPGEAYQTLSYPLKTLLFEDNSTHYIHLYTKNNGELKLRFKYKKDADCQYIDDLMTYDENLKPTLTELLPNEQLSDLLLCPNRPDQFSLSLLGQQYALIALNERTNSKQNDLPFVSPMFQLMDDKKKLIYDKSGFSADPSLTKTEIVHFKAKKDKLQNDNSQEIQNEFILIKNTADSLKNYTLNLSIPEQSQTVEYSISLSLSNDCSPGMLNRTLPLQLNNIEQTRQIQFPPVWSCPNDVLTYRPTLPNNMQLLRAKVEHIFISDSALRPDDIDMASYLSVASNPNHFLVENAQDKPTQWESESLIRNQMLMKPITSDTIFKLKTSVDGYGFSLLSVILNDDDNNQDDSKENKENDNKEDKKDQHDETQKQDSPNQSPDKPSETQATAKGAGEDAQGNESTPDEQAAGENASKLDMQQYERDQIDDLLDAIEKGHYHVPLSGKVEEPQSDKDW